MTRLPGARPYFFGEVLDAIVEVVLVGGEAFELPAHGVDERQLDIEGIRLIEEVGLGLFGEDVGLIGGGFDDGHVEIGLVNSVSVRAESAKLSCTAETRRAKRRKSFFMVSSVAG